MLTLESGFAASPPSRCGAISALAVSQGRLGGPGAPIRTLKGRGFVEISADRGVAPAAPSRMLTLEIGFVASRGEAISTLAVSQGRLGGRVTRAGAGHGDYRIRVAARPSAN